MVTSNRMVLTGLVSLGIAVTSSCVRPRAATFALEHQVGPQPQLEAFPELVREGTQVLRRGRGGTGGDDLGGLLRW
jgi:hypothetical protein